MDEIAFDCLDKEVLVLASANEECNIVTQNYTWTSLEGKKIEVYSLRESYENHLRKGTPDDPYKFYIRWKKGGEEQFFHAKEVKFRGWAGSAFNIADHLASLGVKNVTLAAFVRDGPGLWKLHDYCYKKGINLVPLSASNTGITFVFEDDFNLNSVVCMQKPAEIDCQYNREKLEKKWNVIISSSTPADSEVLRMNIAIFKKNPEAIKTMTPSLSLINNQNREVKFLFEELIGLADVFQVNDTEAGRYLSLDKHQDVQKPIERRKLVFDLVEKIKVPIVIVTMGKSGAAVVATKLDIPDDEKYIDHPALKTRWYIRSTVGSGDAFHAGFVRIYMQLKDNEHGLWLYLAAHMGAELAIRNACVWGGNMSQDETKRLSPAAFMEIVKKYRGVV